MFDSNRDISDFLRSRISEDDLRRTELARSTSTSLCYFLGSQWINPRYRVDRTTLGRFDTNWNPDGNKLRATHNLTTEMIIKSAAATFPRGIYVDVKPPEHASDPQELHKADCLETLINSSIDDSGYIGVRRTANLRRGIFGDYGFGFSIETRMQELNGVELPDRTVKAFCFEPYQLILDPGIKTRNLERHNEVIYCDVWTKNKIRRVFGKDYPDDELQSVGQLTQLHQRFHQLSGGVLYSEYVQHSKTRGARIYQVHQRDETGRFGHVYAMVEKGDGEFDWINPESIQSPFGGSGLPLFMLRGHDRGDGPWSISEAKMVQNDQDALNLDETLKRRMIQKNAGAKMIVDKRWFGNTTDNDKIQDQLSNLVYGIVVGRGGRRDDNIQEPKVMQFPSPPEFLYRSREDATESMRSKVFRPAGAFGETKTHVPAQSFLRAIEEGDQVLGERIIMDIEEDEKALRVLAGTQIRSARMHSPGLLARLKDEGFGAFEFGMLTSLSDTLIGPRIKVRERSVRYRSWNIKRNDLSEAVTNGHIDASRYRRAMADDMDAALSGDDDRALKQARRAAARITMGEEWVPRKLGEYGEWFVREFQLAQLGRSLEGPDGEETRMRLDRAITSQIDTNMQEAIMTDPELYMQAQQQAAQAQQQQQEMMIEQEQDPVSILESALSGISQGGAGAVGQPALTA